MTITDLDEFERWMRGSGLSENTIKQRRTFAEGRLRDWGTLHVGPDIAAGWVGAHSGWTRSTYVNHLTSVYGWMLETGQIEASPIARVRRGPRPRPKPKPLSQKELMLVLGATEGNLRAWILLGSYAGLRSFEIAKFRGEDITESMLYVVGKGGTDEAIPTHEVLWELAQHYPRAGYWFPSPHHARDHVSAQLVGLRVRHLFRDLGLTGSIHRCRATFGTNLLRNGKNIRVIQQLMRHASVATTQHYLGVTNDELRDAIGSLAA
ncbi:tyrosine-type recombinase/integrase [Nocardioides alkalitolerans]|uniref:tyrosine-type recombinase/integrase n=1 Tax=Nocardioides alkalitolerans TaxID=281714 RepID=UPI00048DE2DF|nr:site-specific integrase [Nocardioides alkalitolerans]